jgi:hypothetical protein
MPSGLSRPEPRRGSLRAPFDPIEQGRACPLRPSLSKRLASAYGQQSRIAQLNEAIRRQRTAQAEPLSAEFKGHFDGSKLVVAELHVPRY